MSELHIPYCSTGLGWSCPRGVCSCWCHGKRWRAVAAKQYAPSGLDEFARGFSYRDLNVDDLHDPVWVGDEE